MTDRPVTVWAQGYLLVLIAAGPLTESASLLLVSLPLLAVWGFVVLRRPPALASLGLALGSLLIAPILLPSSIHEFLRAAAILPALPLLDLRLKAAESVVPPAHPRNSGRRTTPLLNSLAFAIGSTGSFAFAVGHMEVVFAALFIAGMLAGRLFYVWFLTRGRPVDILAGSAVRVIAGDSVHSTQLLRNRTRIPLQVAFVPVDPWLTIAPRDATVDGASTVDVGVSATPPLSGSEQPRVWASILDPWGLISIGYVVSPIDLHAIPRARYAAWLAFRYLERGATGTNVANAQMRQAIGRTGVEFQGISEYRPGDRLKDLSSRHSVKYRNLYVKKYADAETPNTAVLLNLVAADVEDRDRLSYQVITAALTAAQEEIPIAIAAYDDRGLSAGVRLTDADGAVRNALRLSRMIRLGGKSERTLAPPNVNRVRRMATLLETLRTDDASEPSTRMSSLLRFELSAMSEAARTHPVSLAVQHALRLCGPQATITVISGWNHDADALSFVLARLLSDGHQVLDFAVERGTRG